MGVANCTIEESRGSGLLLAKRGETGGAELMLRRLVSAVRARTTGWEATPRGVSEVHALAPRGVSEVQLDSRITEDTWTITGDGF